MSYEKKRLGEYIDILPGYAFKSNMFSETGIPIIKIKNIIPPYVDLEDTSFVPKDEANAHNKFYLHYNDVLIALTGSHINQMASVVGRVARVKYNCPSLLNQRVGKVTIKNSDACDINYVYYFLSQESTKITLASKAGGAANQANISPSDVKNLMIPFPDIEIQHRIADILSAYDDLVENNQKQIRLLEEAAQRLYKEWFIDFCFPGSENAVFVNDIPEGWHRSSIKDLCIRICAGGTPNRRKTSYWAPSEIRWFKTKELQDCWLFDSEECISREGLDNSSAKVFPKNTILMAIYASPTLGRLGILSAKATCNQAALCLVADESKASWQWLYQKLYELRSDFNAVAIGAGQQNISSEVVKNKIITVPSHEIIKRYTEMITPYFEKIRLLQLQNQKMIQARNMLLPKLMSGELEV